MDDIEGMFNQVNMMLKSNPEMVKKVSKCVKSIFKNDELIAGLVNEIKDNVEVEEEDSGDDDSGDDELKKDN
jgi:ribosomal protein L30/L7E